TTTTSSLCLHDALPIFPPGGLRATAVAFESTPLLNGDRGRFRWTSGLRGPPDKKRATPTFFGFHPHTPPMAGHNRLHDCQSHARSEEHTSELQSREKLV